MIEVVAQRGVQVIKPDDETFKASIGFRKPHECENHGWYCELIMEGTDTQYYGAGVDIPPVMYERPAARK
jgi:hypothetical protein